MVDARRPALEPADDDQVRHRRRACGGGAGRSPSACGRRRSARARDRTSPRRRGRGLRERRAVAVASCLPCERDSVAKHAGASPALDVFRTPDERFEGLPGYDFEPNYAEFDGLRMHYVDEGEGRPVVCFHGEPTWAYLYRKMLAPLVEAGHRVICPDLAGFGRSDKPTDRGWYSYDAPRRAGLPGARRARPQRRRGRRPGLGRPDRAALGGRERRPRRRARDPEHGPVHRAACRRASWPGGSSPRRTRTSRSATWSGGGTTTDLPDDVRRRLRGAVPDRRVEGGRGPVPAAGPDLRRRPGRRPRCAPSPTS